MRSLSTPDGFSGRKLPGGLSEALLHCKDDVEPVGDVDRPVAEDPLDRLSVRRPEVRGDHGPPLWLTTQTLDFDQLPEGLFDHVLIAGGQQIDQLPTDEIDEDCHWLLPPENLVDADVLQGVEPVRCSPGGGSVGEIVPNPGIELGQRDSRSAGNQVQRFPLHPGIDAFHPEAVREMLRAASALC